MMLLCIMKMPGNRAETICILGKIVNSHFNAFNLGRIWIILNSFFIVIYKTYYKDTNETTWRITFTHKGLFGSFYN